MRQYLEYDPIVGWRFIPGVRVRIPHEGGGYLVRANELGFRSDAQFVDGASLWKTTTAPLRRFFHRGGWSIERPAFRRSPRSARSQS